MKTLAQTATLFDGPDKTGDTGIVMLVNSDTNTVFRPARTIMHETLHMAQTVGGKKYDDHQFDADGVTPLPPTGNIMNSLGTSMTQNQRDLLQSSLCEETQN